MLLAQGRPTTPRIACLSPGRCCNHSSPGMRGALLSDKGVPASAKSGRRRPASARVVAAAASNKAENQMPLVAPLPSAATFCTPPSWSDAATRMYVSAGLEAIVQPRLDSFAERLGDIVAQAQEELRDFENVVERIEYRTDGRLSGLEARVAVLVDGASRTEQRERELNARLANMAEGALRGPDEATATAAAVDLTRLADLERRMLEIYSRLQASEDIGRKGNTNIRFLEDRVKDLEDQRRVASRFAEETRSLLEAKSTSVKGSPLAATESSAEVIAHAITAAAAAAQTAAAAQSAAGAQAGRVARLEEQVSSVIAELNADQAQKLHTDDKYAEAARAAQHVTGVAIETLTQSLRADFEDLNLQCGDVCAQVVEQGRQIDAQCNDARAAAERQHGLSSRVDDINARVGALKIKSDNLESRLQAVQDRVERNRHSPEAYQIQQQILERCERLEKQMFEPRLEAVEQNLMKLQSNCEDLVESSLEKRLDILSGMTATTREGQWYRRERP